MLLLQKFLGHTNQKGLNSDNSEKTFGKFMLLQVMISHPSAPPITWEL